MINQRSTFSGGMTTVQKNMLGSQSRSRKLRVKPSRLIYIWERLVFRCQRATVLVRFVLCLWHIFLHVFQRCLIASVPLPE